MANTNQVIVNGETILDLRSDTVTPATLKKGETAHDASGAPIVGTMESAAHKLQSKSVSYTSNGTATVTPDAGYDGLSSVDVTVDVASGGGGGAGFSVTFPATATNWGKVSICAIVQADGTVIDIKDYSTVAGKTIPNVIEICCQGDYGYYMLHITVQTGKIMMTYLTLGMVFATIAVDGESSRIYMGDGAFARWIPLADTVISAIEMYYTD